MFARSFYPFFIMLLLIMLSACSEKPREVNIAINTTFNGQALIDATVYIDETEAGRTDDQGNFKTMIMRKYETPINLKINKKIHGYKLEAWEKQLTFNAESGDSFSLSAGLTGVAFVTFKVVDGKNAVKGAKIRFGKDNLGKTDEKGLLVYNLPAVNDTKVRIKATKYGHESWNKKLVIVPGDVIEASIRQQLLLRVSTMTEKYNESVDLPKIHVYLGKKLLGKTNKNGNFRIDRRGLKGKKGQLRLVANGYLPESWEKQINLSGNVKIKRFFYPQKQEPLRVGMFRFISNTAGEDIGSIPNRFQVAIEKRLKNIKGIKIVDTELLADLFKKSKLSPEKAKENGWKKTDLYKEIDVIVFGSVTKDLKGRFIVEAKFHSADGTQGFSQIVTAKNAGKIDRAAKEIAIKVGENYPIIGRVIKQNGKEYKVNLGDDISTIESNNQFLALNPAFDKEGKLTSYKEVGTVVIDDTDDEYSIAKIQGLEDKASLAVGAKLIRQDPFDAKNTKFVTISAKSEIRGSIQKLQGVNIYLDEKWMGATDKNGKAKISVALKKEYDISLYRHGFSQIVGELEVNKNAELKEFMLESYYSTLKVESTPSNASVFIDDENIGRTPMIDGKPVSTGFHTVRISAGGDWRDWEEVMEFSTDEVDWTGEESIEFDKNYLNMGEKAADAGRVDEAISMFSKADKDHPDYAEAHHSLAQLYLDKKQNVDAAIKEFELVVAIPEIKALIYKQFAITYTNLGHAYHEKASAVMHSDKRSAAQFFVKSIKSLEKAKENSRFFPNEYYDEAIHDTYYYIALSYHKLYQLSNKASLLNKAELAWRDYLDFYPAKLEDNAEYLVSRDSAEKFVEQLKK
ncbi:MAG: PEGA domain-containing protein [Gammaproteobacteria bacterium]|nr:PEGA domain-containing protein [Gammaproteobacteria bacterium]